MVKMVLEHYGLSGSDDRGVLYYPGSIEDWLEKQKNSKDLPTSEGQGIPSISSVTNTDPNQASTQMEFEKNEANQHSPKRQQLSSQDATDEIPRDSHAGDKGLSGTDEDLSDK